MPRPPRMEYPGAFYHVYSRGNRKEKIYHSTGDYQLFETILMEAAERCQVSLYAWCLMPNHFHLLIETPLGNISIFMRCLLTRYARLFNLRHKLVGHVFQSRYQALVCEKESTFLVLVRYIHLNPVRAKVPLVKKLDEWRWSSHRHYMNGDGPETVRWAARAFFGGGKQKGRYSCRMYLDFLDQSDAGVDAEAETTLSANGNRILGGDSFIDELQKKRECQASDDAGSLRAMASCAALRDETCRLFGVRPADLAGPNRNQSLGRIRRALVFVGRRYYRFSSAELGRILNRDGTAVSHMMRRHQTEGENTPEVKRLIEGCR